MSYNLFIPLTSRGLFWALKVVHVDRDYSNAMLELSKGGGIRSLFFLQNLQRCNSQGCIAEYFWEFCNYKFTEILSGTYPCTRYKLMFIESHFELQVLKQSHLKGF